MSQTIFRASPTLVWAVLGYVAIWGGSTLYLAGAGTDWIFPIVSLGLFGGLLTALAVWLTRRTAAPTVPVRRPIRESLVLLAYLAVYAVLFLGPVMSWLRSAIPPGPGQELAVIAFKLAIHLVIPILLLRAAKASLEGTTDPGLSRKGVVATLVVFGAILVGLQTLVSPSLRQIAALDLSPFAVGAWILGAWAWISIEAGLCEEFFYRVLLQSRLGAWFGSAPLAIATTAIVFALAHAPGLYLRGGPGVEGWSQNPVEVAAYTIATLSPIAIMFGTLWHRTRSLVLVVMLHGAVDALPATARFATIWGG
ncbi:CPBP family intramembrane metalloprotease [Sphingorhabdus soli]|uniref:CPBP family intramembrane metalloprotease n=1 Tax=Flavisphingopyxis soli TaxID=2601267 RepID=A0A5C6UMA9_9SPHN|nr:CPBP family intramembrane glutamic endopeptidase [Sphingorhabdus soli]TXC73226.1 CPBP family intramembrane metalloprotease [Sphingorhabdus soli]